LKYEFLKKLVPLLRQSEIGARMEKKVSLLSLPGTVSLSMRSSL
jgi:hypothetical protein